MASLVRKFRSAKTSTLDCDDDEDYFNLDYSIAIEYNGPPVSHDIPKVIPIDIEQIPIATSVTSVYLSGNLFLPVIQPISKSKQTPTQELKVEDEIDYANGEKRFSDLSDRVGRSTELSHNLEIEMGLPGDVEEEKDFENYMDPANSESTDSVPSSQSLSSEVGSLKEEEFTNEIACHKRRPSTVKFRDPSSNDIFEKEEGEHNHPELIESVQVRPKIERVGKKGSCYRCGKGNKYTEKEVCIVCGAKYCCICVVRAMGSMPEGRKCLSCIGHRIDESRRKKLGKCSRILKRLFTEFQVEKIMKSEVSCEANQIPCVLIVVNGEPISQDELVKLQTSPNAPRNLKAGSYWYDNVSGYWGKEGQRPCKIISPDLNIGGQLKENASNGNTNISINNRKVTKAELLMLKFAGIPCEGKLAYWVNADGSCQEEGMNNVIGNIWDKTGIKLFCYFWSLAIPKPSWSLAIPKPSAEGGDKVNPSLFEEKMLNKLLLVGPDKSGTSTIFKQAKSVYNVPFSEEERENIKLMIQSKLYGYLGILLQGRQQFEEEILVGKQKGPLTDQPSTSGMTGQIDQIDGSTIYSLGSPRLQAFADWLLKVIESGNLEVMFPAATREYAQFVEDLWNDSAIQATYNRRNELEMLSRAATYFLSRAIEISRTDYEPSEMDLVYAEGITLSNGISCMEFSFPKLEKKVPIDSSFYEHDPLLRNQLIRVHPRCLGGNCKWLQMFDDVNMVLFCVSLADYDEFYVDANGSSVNKMMASKQLFESVVTCFKHKEFLLILNKFDLLEEKIEEAPLPRCEWFNDFNPVISHNPSSSSNNSNSPTLPQRAFQYIGMKFKRLFSSLTDRKLYVSVVTGLESDTVGDALKYAREILKWTEEKHTFEEEQKFEVSTASNETSTTP